MSLRELADVIHSRNRTRRAEAEMQNHAHLAIAARVTSELVNIVGTLGAGRDWKNITAKRYYDAWTSETSPPEDARDRIERAKQITKTRQEREKWSF